MGGDLGEEAGVGVFELAEALTCDGAGVAVEAVIGAVDDGEQQLYEALEVARRSVEGVEGDHEGGGGDHHLLLE